MADTADEAARYEAVFLQAALRNRQHAAKTASPAGDGRCLNCQTPVPNGARWCDTDCRDDWQAEQKRKAR